MRLGSRRFFILLILLNIAGCSSEDAETTQVSSSNKTASLTEQSLEGSSVTINGTTTPLKGRPNLADVKLNFENAGIRQGFTSLDDYMLYAVITDGVMSTGDQSNIALSQCVATSGLVAMDKLWGAVGGQEVGSKLETNRDETQAAETLESIAGMTLPFNTSNGITRYKIVSEQEITSTHTLEGEDYMSSTRAIQLSDESGKVCTLDESLTKRGTQQSTQQSWDCDIQALNRLFKNNQNALTQYVGVKWIGSEMEGSRCSSAFVFRIP